MGPHSLGRAKPLRGVPLSVQARCWGGGVWIWGAVVGLGQLCAQSQMVGCSPRPMGHPTLPAPHGDPPCGAEGAEGFPALGGGCLILLLMAPLR